MLGFLLAHKIGAKCCLDWNPTTPGATFENMYENAGPNEKSHLWLFWMSLTSFLTRFTATGGTSQEFDNPNNQQNKLEQSLGQV